MKSWLPKFAAPFFAVVIIVLLIIFSFANDLREPFPNLSLTATTSVAASIIALEKQSTNSVSNLAQPRSTNVKMPSVLNATSLTRKAVESRPEKAVGASTASRIESPYSFDPLPFETIDLRVRGALVNILCMPKNGSFRPTSGSGVIIDPQGVILTNAHVAQYVLLSQDTRIDLSCTIRTGSPAAPSWVAQVLHIPPTWIDDHFTDIVRDRPTGTGEHDYALLQITSDAGGGPAIGPFPYLPVDTRENIAFQDDTVLVAGYPAEFTGGIIAQRGLYAVTTLAKIGKLYTFKDGTVDLFSLGNIISAQGGSSGGPVVNQWDHLVGIVTTTSDGSTTASRDLHATALSYIDRDIKIQSGESLSEMLSQDTRGRAAFFSQDISPGLIEKYIKILTR